MVRDVTKIMNLITKFNKQFEAESVMFIDHCERLKKLTVECRSNINSLKMKDVTVC